MTQVKVVHYSVNDACGDLRKAADSMHTSFKAEVMGETRLQMAEELNRLNSSFSTLLATYQDMLTNHVEATKKTAKTLEKTDIELASALSFIKN